MKLINPMIILRIFATILLIVIFSFLICIPVAIIYGEPVRFFLWPLIIAVTMYLAVRIATKNTYPRKLTIREGFLAVTLSWLLLSVMGTLPYLFSSTIESFINAFFESAASFTTTGSSTISDLEILPYSILFWRSFAHWIGGIGIIVLVIIILPSLSAGGQQLLSLEWSFKEKVLPKTKAFGFRLLIIYIGLTIAEIILLSVGDMNLFDSICHTFGTVSTSGVSTKNSSLMNYSAYSQYVVAVFMFLSGVNYVLYYYFIKLQFSKIRKNEELWFYSFTVFFAGVLVTVLLLANTAKSFETAFREGFFQVVSFITTSGFLTTDYMLWPASGILLIFLLMFTGASAGSSTGSIKMARHLVALKNVARAFRKLSHHNVITPIFVNGKQVPEAANIRVLSFILLYIAIFIAGTAAIVLNGVDIITSASAVAASLGNVGSGMGLVGPFTNYSGLPGLSKVILGLLMIVGRLELFTVVVLFSRSFWKV